YSDSCDTTGGTSGLNDSLTAVAGRVQAAQRGGLAAHAPGQQHRGCPPNTGSSSGCRVPAAAPGQGPACELRLPDRARSLCRLATCRAGVIRGWSVLLSGWPSSSAAPPGRASAKTGADSGEVRPWTAWLRGS